MNKKASQDTGMYKRETIMDMEMSSKKSKNSPLPRMSFVKFWENNEQAPSQVHKKSI